MVMSLCNKPQDLRLLSCNYSLGLLSDEVVDLAGSPLDTLCSHLQRRLQYEPGERDAVYLHHFIGIEWPDKRVRIGMSDTIIEVACVRAMCILV